MSNAGDYKTSRAAINLRMKEQLRAWRKAKRFSQREAAALFGVPLKTYQKWEEKAPKRGMPADHLAQFCLMADADPAWLLLGRKSVSAPPQPVAAEKTPRRRTRKTA